MPVDTYGHAVSESKELQRHLNYLKQILNYEVRRQRDILKLMGIIDTLITASTVNWSNGGTSGQKGKDLTRDSIVMDVDSSKS